MSLRQVFKDRGPYIQRDIVNIYIIIYIYFIDNRYALYKHPHKNERGVQVSSRETDFSLYYLKL